MYICTVSDSTKSSNKAQTYLRSLRVALAKEHFEEERVSIFLSHSLLEFLESLSRISSLDELAFWKEKIYLNWSDEIELEGEGSSKRTNFELNQTLSWLNDGLPEREMWKM